MQNLAIINELINNFEILNQNYDDRLINLIKKSGDYCSNEIIIEDFYSKNKTVKMLKIMVRQMPHNLIDKIKNDVGTDLKGRSLKLASNDLKHIINIHKIIIKIVGI